MVGVPAAVSVYRKLALPVPAGIVSNDDGVNEPVPDVLLRLTVTALLASATFPKASSSVTVIVPDATPAVRVCGEVVNARRLAAAGVDGFVLIAWPGRLPRPQASGVPAKVSVYWKLAVVVAGGDGQRRQRGERALGGSRVQADRQWRCRRWPGCRRRLRGRPSWFAKGSPAVKVCAAVMNVSWLAAAATTVSCCVAGAKAAAAAVSVGVPVVVSA